jgi:hypothetical protein
LDDFFLNEVVYSVFSAQNPKGQYRVASFDGREHSEVCTFTLDSKPSWLGKWGRASHRDTIAERAFQVVRRHTG